MSAVRVATVEDIDTLVALMTEFYAESGYECESTVAASSFRALVADEQLGRVWLASDGEQPIGYIVLTLGYSLEYGGRDAFVDDLFVREPFRGLGLGRALLDNLLAECRNLDVRAVHLEVARDNLPAKRLYAKRGFRDNERQLLTKRLTESAAL